jgi:hypothetical protein
MTFAAPWALWGLLLLAGPVLVHLLSRRTATRRPFPTLRFLDAARLQPVSRRTLDDRALLALRLLIVALAVLAWARPQRTTRSSVAGRTEPEAMALLVDTSASMERGTRNGMAAVAEARRLADSAAAGVARVLRVETGLPAAALRSAAEWLHSAGGGTLLLVTDAQRGTIIPSDVEALPGSVRLVIQPVPVARADTRVLRRVADSMLGGVLVVHSAEQLRDSSSPFYASDSAITYAPHVLAIAGIATHPLLQEMLARHPLTHTEPAPGDPQGWIAVPTTPRSDAAIVAWIRPSRPVVLQLALEASHPVARALVTITEDALRDAADRPLREYEPTVLDAAQLTTLERVAAERTRATTSSSMPDAAADGTSSRVLWILVLLALGGEWWLRNRLTRVVSSV